MSIYTHEVCAFPQPRSSKPFTSLRRDSERCHPGGPTVDSSRFKLARSAKVRAWPLSPSPVPSSSRAVQLEKAVVYSHQNATTKSIWTVPTVIGPHKKRHPTQFWWGEMPEICKFNPIFPWQNLRLPKFADLSLISPRPQAIILSSLWGSSCSPKRPSSRLSSPCLRN